MKVLISAYTCMPGRGSEPGVGWLWARAAAERHEVWLLTHPYNEKLIPDALRQEDGLTMTPVYVAPPAWSAAVGRIPALSYVTYLAWQWKAAQAARSLHATERFDVAHHLTYANDWLPAGAAWVPGLPMVWGPVGGAAGTQVRLWRYLRWRSVGFELARSGLSAVARRLGGDATARRASLIVANNPPVARRFARFGPVVTEPNCAMAPVPPVARPSPSDGERRAVFVGRLVGWKGPHLAVAAIAQPAAAGWTLDLMGVGPEMRRCQRLARRLGVADRVRFRGWVPRQQLLEELARADCLIHPSMHDQASWAVGEALSAGVPVVCFELGGPGFLVPPDQGVTVSLSGEVIKNLAEGLRDVTAPTRREDRFDLHRLPALLDGWYEKVARHAG